MDAKRSLRVMEIVFGILVVITSFIACLFHSSWLILLLFITSTLFGFNEGVKAIVNEYDLVCPAGLNWFEQLPKNITDGEKYGRIIHITDQREADRYFELCVRHTMRFGYSRQDAEDIEKYNIGYFSRYCDPEIRQRIQRLFKCEHPFGLM